MNDNTHWLGLYAIVAIAICVITGLSLNYNKTKNQALLKATSCEQLLAISESRFQALAIYCAGVKK